MPPEKEQSDPEIVELQKEGHRLERLTSHPLFAKTVWGIGILLVVFIAGYLYVTSGRVYIEKSQIYAPTINLSAEHPGLLEQVYATQGEYVRANDAIARVGGEIIRAKVDGVVISADSVLGTYFNPGQTVASMYAIADLRVNGRLEEDKGLDKIKAGQPVIFTADTFGSKQFSGTVVSVSPVASNPDIVFSISDRRAENEFIVRVQYNFEDYPELKPGMSARMWVYIR